MSHKEAVAMTTGSLDRSTSHEEHQEQTFVHAAPAIGAAAGDECYDSIGSEERLVNTAAPASTGSSSSSTMKITTAASIPPTLLETIVCFCFCIVGVGAVLLTLILLDPEGRPMPIQYLESSQEYVMRLSNNEIYQGETLNTIYALLLCIIAPVMIQLACNKFLGQPGDIYRTICTYCVAITLTAVTTEIIKNYVGYLRPVYFDQCNPTEDYETCQGRQDEDEHHLEVKELHKSFVSGHASIGFAGLTLFSMFLERTFGLSSVEAMVVCYSNGSTHSSSNNAGAAAGADEELQPMRTSMQQQQQQQSTVNSNTNPSFQFVTTVYETEQVALRRMGSIVSLIPMLVAVWAACTRLVDNVHFPADVVGGAVLGASIAVYCQPLWFPHPKYTIAL